MVSGGDPAGAPRCNNETRVFLVVRRFERAAAAANPPHNATHTSRPRASNRRHVLQRPRARARDVDSFKFLLNISILDPIGRSGMVQLDFLKFSSKSDPRNPPKRPCLNISFLNCLLSWPREGPGGFKELREACGIRVHLSWYLSVFLVPSYDQKNLRGCLLTGGGGYTKHSYSRFV